MENKLLESCEEINPSKFNDYSKKNLNQNKLYSTKEKNSNIFNNNISEKSINDNESTIASISDKTYYRDMKNLKDTLTKIYPKFFDNFELIEYISSGGAGIVYEGKLKKGKKKQKLAIKFKFNIKKKEDSKESQEISILRKLHHKNTTEIYAYIRMNDYSNFCVLELGKHGDLENFQKVLLKRKVLSETIINYFSKQILDALEYIHRCKIIHMDIKQGNILVDSNLNIKLTDFSVSCSYSSFNNEDLVKFPFVGTSKYMSPEIIGRTHIKIKEAQKIDLYSLGVTLYDLAFGVYPYELNEIGNKDYDNILKNIKKEKLKFPKDRKVSELFKDFLRGLLVEDYKKRFTIKQALNHPWVKASKIIFDEKENSFCHENFLISLITDNIRKFNEYLKNISIK